MLKEKSFDAFFPKTKGFFINSSRFSDFAVL